MHASPTPRGEPGRRSFACISSGIATVIQVAGGAIKGTITDLMSHSQFHCTDRVHLDLHGLIFETSICYWQDQPGKRPWKENRDDAGLPTHGSRSASGLPGGDVEDGAAAHRGARAEPSSAGAEGVGGRWVEAVTGKGAFRAGRRGAKVGSKTGWGLWPRPSEPSRAPTSSAAVADIRFRRAV